MAWPRQYVCRSLWLLVMRTKPPITWFALIDWRKRFWLRVYPRGDCWEFRGPKHPWGYGHFDCWFLGTKHAHRTAFWLATDRLPEQLHHLCGHPWCVRPTHLMPVSNREHRAYEPLARATHCKRGHPFNEANTYWHKPRNGRTNGLRACRKCHAIAESARQRRTA